MTKADFQKLFAYWLDGSKRDRSAADSLAKTSHFAQALFFAHLSLEKKAKALCVKTAKDHAPYSHNLVYLFGKAGVVLDEQLISVLDIMNSFNIKGRYPDEKEEFYKISTKKYYTKWEKEFQVFHDILDKML